VTVHYYIKAVYILRTAILYKLQLHGFNKDKYSQNNCLLSYLVKQAYTERGK